MNQISVDVQRAGYMRAWQLFNTMLGGDANNPIADQYIIEPHTLIIEGQPSTNGKTEFNLEYGFDGDKSGNEILLDKADAAVLWGIGIQITKVNPATKDYASQPLFTYPDAAYFDGATAAGEKESDALMSLYRGKLTLNTANIDRIKELTTTHMLNVPERIAPSAGQLPQFGSRLEDEGIFLLQPMPLLDGKVTNKFTLNYGKTNYAAIEGGLDAAGNEIDTENRVFLVLHTWRASNIAKSFNDNKMKNHCGYV